MGCTKNNAGIISHFYGNQVKKAIGYNGHNYLSLHTWLLKRYIYDLQLAL